jgi:hypothetical protein
MEALPPVETQAASSRTTVQTAKNKLRKNPTIQARLRFDKNKGPVHVLALRRFTGEAALFFKVIRIIYLPRKRHTHDTIFPMNHSHERRVSVRMGLHHPPRKIWPLVLSEEFVDFYIFTNGHPSSGSYA